MSTNVQNFLNYFENFLSPMSINISLFFKTFYRVVIPVLNISLFFKLFIYVDLSTNLQLTLSKNLYCQLHFCSAQCLRLKGAIPSIVSNRFCYVITRDYIERKPPAELVSHSFQRIFQKCFVKSNPVTTKTSYLG
jgi:hypothetical protein